MPSNVREFTGNAGKRRPNPREPRPETPKTAPAPPPDLSEAAKPYWLEYAQQLTTLRVLSASDHQALALLCEATATWWECIQKVRETGILVKVGKQGFTQRNPYLTEANVALKQMNNLLAEFGLTPSSRTRVQADQ